MVTHLCNGAPDDTVAIYLEKIRKCQSPVESLMDIYVTDREQHLLGVVPLPLLLKSEPLKKLNDLLQKPSVYVHPGTDRERAARLAIHHEVDTLPVLDKEHHLIGILPGKSLMKILHEESLEDLLRSAGYRRSHKERFIDVLGERITGLIRARLPWLLLGLLGGMLGTFLVSLFEGALRQHVVLAFFMPVIVYMADAVGTQTEALYLRLYDTGEFKVRSYLFRELQVAIGIGLISAPLIFLYTILIFQTIKIGVIVSLAMLVTSLVSVLIATLIPTILVSLKKDPALGSGPFATAVQDILSLLIYFAIAAALL